MRNLRGSTRLPIYAASSIFVRHDSGETLLVLLLLVLPLLILALSVLLLLVLPSS